ncbi:lipocalin-like domain-containing protein [Mycolicibacterium chlorophenolicum]|uniref:Uncharacterized protein n=1 Tax=Mycolicibacterium chlorophenolicum TaxID=37916 RepID=A0A0J6WM45_9MYCO|nr:lipocalin-like domain-containing protein [Mycolicibacterium chlorophenolicum]KMO83664.1 hypothetical protein MCHLDSM_00316 [Mycolicibacterium chlorophenolicum]
MIASRRAKVEDRHRDRLPDSADADPREVLDYLRQYSGIDIPRWVLQADITDALTLNNWLWWEDRRRELHFLKAGRDRNVFLSQIGRQIGVGKQGVLDRIDRLEALLRYDRPNEKITREARNAARASRDRRPVEQAWINTHHDELVAVIDGLVAQAGRYRIDDDDREWIDEIAVDVREDDLTPSTMVILGLAAAELRTSPAVLALNSTRPHGVHSVLSRADKLRSEFAELGNAASAKSTTQ